MQTHNLKASLGNLKKLSTKIVYGPSMPRGRILDRNYNVIVDNVGTNIISYKKEANVSVKDEIDYAYLLAEKIDINYAKLTKNSLKDFWIVNNKEYDLLVKRFIKKGNSYPLSCSMALNELTGKLINKPNDVLALEYIRNIRVRNSNIKPISIKRTTDYHDKEIDKRVASATSIRRNLNNVEKIKMVMPKISIDFIQKIDQEKYFELIKYQIISSYDLNCYLDVDEGIENKLKKTINEVNNLNDLILRVKSKRYSYSKIQRMLLHIVCKFKKSDNDLKLKYIRVLGLNDNGAKIIREVKKNINIPIITKYKKEYDDLFKIDKKANFIYSLLTDYDMASEFKSCIKK
jgi:hypothetical protein